MDRLALAIFVFSSLRDRKFIEVEAVSRSAPPSFNWCHDAVAQIENKDNNQTSPSTTTAAATFCTPIDNQYAGLSHCGSCWASAALSVLSDRIAAAPLTVNTNIMFSLQDVLSCGSRFSPSFGSGCSGGSADSVYEYSRVHGLVEANCNIYRANDDDDNGRQCHEHRRCWTCMPPSHAHEPECRPVTSYNKYFLSSHGYVSGEDNMINEIFNNGPIVCGIALSTSFNSYTGGIFSFHAPHNDTSHHRGRGRDRPPSFTLSHDVSVVGWGVGSSDELSPASASASASAFAPVPVPVPYWLVRNSYGSFWGESGFFRVVRDTMHSGGIETDCVYPNVRDIKRVTQTLTEQEADISNIKQGKERGHSQTLVDVSSKHEGGVQSSSSSSSFSSSSSSFSSVRSSSSAVSSVSSVDVTSRVMYVVLVSIIFVPSMLFVLYMHAVQSRTRTRTRRNMNVRDVQVQMHRIGQYEEQEEEQEEKRAGVSERVRVREYNDNPAAVRVHPVSVDEQPQQRHVPLWWLHSSIPIPPRSLRSPYKSSSAAVAAVPTAATSSSSSSPTSSSSSSISPVSSSPSSSPPYSFSSSSLSSSFSSFSPSFLFSSLSSSSSSSSSFFSFLSPSDWLRRHRPDHDSANAPLLNQQQQRNLSTKYQTISS